MSEADNKVYIHNNLDSDWFNVILYSYCIVPIYIQTLQTLNKVTYNPTHKPCNKF